MGGVWDAAEVGYNNRDNRDDYEDEMQNEPDLDNQNDEDDVWEDDNGDDDNGDDEQ